MATPTLSTTPDILDARLNALVDELAQFQDNNGLSRMCANDQMHDAKTTPEQKKWLADFCRRWDELYTSE